MRHPLRRRLLHALTAYAVGVSALFALLAMGLVYTVEDRHIERALNDEARLQHAHFATHGRWARPSGAGIQLHPTAASLPPDLARVLAAEPLRREAAGDDGRHYHLLPLRAEGQPPWLVTEVGGALIVRGMRQELLLWLALGALAGLAAACLLAWWLARRISAPLEALAARVARAAPGRPPPAGEPRTRHQPGRPDRPRQPDGPAPPDDEVAVVARNLDALLARIQAFVEREQAFTRDVSHELRTPVAVLRAAIERLQASHAPGAELPQQLAAMHAATLLMQRTIDTLLLLARAPADGPLQGSADAPPGPRHPVPLLPLAERWVLAHAGWLDAQALTLDLRLQRGDALALPEPVLELALASLLGNAFAHGASGGVVTVSLVQGALCIRNPVATEAGGGPAGPRPAHDGLGLGLGIVRRLVARHGGRLEVAQAAGVASAVLAAGPGEGTTGL